MSVLETPTGDLTSDQKNIKDLFRRFHKELYASEVKEKFLTSQFFANLETPKVDAGHRADLDNPLFLQKIIA